MCEGVRVLGLGLGLGLGFGGLGGMVGMEENAELEEGEASYYRDDEDKIIDPDISLSYIVRASLCFIGQLFDYFFVFGFN